jgi:NADPH:quinone reductase-like Zn-dependent oxidoreductase
MEYKKIVVEKFGSPENLKIRSSFLNKIGFGQVRVRLLAAGVSFSDIMVQRGGYLLARKTPLTPGYDFVGIVESIGVGISDFKIGDYVGGLKPDLGCYSEYIDIDQGYLVSVPPEISPEKAVALILNYLTASCALSKKAKIQKGESLLIHAAAGGVGTALMQMGNLLKLKMYGTASRKKHTVLKSYGVAPIDYQKEDFVNFVLNLEKSGVDIAIDSFGGDYIKRSY